MTPQEIFDAVVRHTYTQKGPCFRETTRGRICAYRGDNGRKCFVGAVIPDKLYEPEMDEYINAAGSESSYNAYALIRRFTGLPGWMRDNESLLFHLQRAHDRFVDRSDDAFTDVIGDRLETVATAHRLNTETLRAERAKYEAGK